MEIHHIGFLVKDLKKSEKQFMDLGYKIEGKGKAFDHIRNVNIEFLINGTYRVELIEPVDSTSELYPLIKKYKNQPYHVCYLTDDMEKTIAELLEKHFIVINPPQAAPCIGTGKQKVTFLSGRGIEMIELLEKTV